MPSAHPTAVPGRCDPVSDVRHVDKIAIVNEVTREVLILSDAAQRLYPIVFARPRNGVGQIEIRQSDMDRNLPAQPLKACESVWLKGCDHQHAEGYAIFVSLFQARLSDHETSPTSIFNTRRASRSSIRIVDSSRAAAWSHCKTLHTNRDTFLHYFTLSRVIR
jgi:hypothetical protein